jgi:hypothetical protein
VTQVRNLDSEGTPREQPSLNDKRRDRPAPNNRGTPLQAWRVGCALALGLVGTAGAQVNEKFADLNDEIEMLRTLTQAQRQDLVTGAMELTPQESTAFWPVYREYRGEFTKLNDRVVKLITDYASLSDSQSKTLLQDFLTLQADVVALRKKYEPRFSKVLPPVKALRFYQIENKLDTVVNLTFVVQVPLAGTGAAP